MSDCVVLGLCSETGFAFRTTAAALSGTPQVEAAAVDCGLVGASCKNKQGLTKLELKDCEWNT